MATAEVLAAEDGPFNAPHDYVLSAGEAFEPTTIAAQFDGTGAAGAFLACCSFLSQDGKLLGRVFPAAIAKGDVAVVTYSPFALSPSNVFAAAATADRGDLVLAGAGVLSQTFDRWLGQGTKTSASGRAWYFPIGLVAGDVVTGATVYHSAAGVGVTLYKVGLFLPDGSSRVAVTANRSADANAAVGYKPMPFLAQYVVPTSGRYYLGVISVTGTSPTWLHASNAASGNAAVGLPPAPGGDNAYYTDAGPLADLPTSFSKAALGSPPATVAPAWFGVYT